MDAGCLPPPLTLFALDANNLLDAPSLVASFFFAFLLVYCFSVVSACLAHFVGATLGGFTQTLPFQFVLCTLLISSTSAAMSFLTSPLR
jgi:hypothetical protein